ncbi:hypothetical protein CAPTEDRAFT_188726 [Capitella teleta]|uniref:IPT/TIG domain-containing protein n=1 Tax=Capitella teleta TaxID=283909 RepID=R7TD68_CAPTE|nr:hypothetical protein CAPTEDRAFT_188726 [Capitella teleta]|eukprot:ELT89011.1 hypothetical protein CAPTEDRAFT_188726 [Capitella teleta]
MVVVDCELSSAAPLYGPVSGGTQVNFTGYPLSVCTPKWVDFGPQHLIPLLVFVSGLPETHTELSETITFSILTAAAPNLEDYINKELPISVIFNDKNLKLDTPFNFTYLSDPTVSDFFPVEHVPQGGTGVTVKGDGFLAVVQPRMTLTPITTNRTAQGTKTTTGDPLTTDCKVQNSSQMICPVPELDVQIPDLPVTTVAPDAGAVSYGFSIGFKFDGVKTFDNVSTVPALKDKIFTLRNPPSFLIGDLPAYKPQEHSIISIHGDLRDWTNRGHEIIVKVGLVICTHRDVLSRMVHVGNSEVFIGCLEYINDNFPLYATIGGVAAGLIILVAGIVFFVARRMVNGPSEPPRDGVMPDPNGASQTRHHIPSSSWHNMQYDPSEANPVSASLDLSRGPSAEGPPPLPRRAVRAESPDPDDIVAPTGNSTQNWTNSVLTVPQVPSAAPNHDLQERFQGRLFVNEQRT